MTQPRIAVVSVSLFPSTRNSKFNETFDPCSGSGIGGLVFCAAFGQRSSSELDLYESASKLGEIGAGIGSLAPCLGIRKV